jgi:hypothetical protein
MPERDATGKFRPRGPETPTGTPKKFDPAQWEAVFDATNAQQRMIEQAWRERQLPAAIARLRRVTDNLFVEATLEQSIIYETRRMQNTQQLVEMIQDGATDAAVLAEARRFYTDMLGVPRTPPPAPTPKSERERVERDLCNGQYHKVPYVGPEMDALEFILGQEPPETRIERFDVKSITLSSGRVIQRRELREYYPVGTAPSRLESGWYRQFPAPASYESDHDPGRVPVDQRVTVIRE